jgi:hypothetical protein
MKSLRVQNKPRLENLPLESTRDVDSQAANGAAAIHHGEFNE